MQYSYNLEKDKILRETRGFGFENIISAIGDGNLIAVEKHSNNEKYSHQNILYVRMSDGIYAIPSVINGEEIFFKTAYRSRVATKRFNS